MSKYKKRNCEPRPCSVCGKVFTPAHGNRRMCDDCYETFGKNKRLNVPTLRFKATVDVDQYEYELRKRNVENHRDTIVAIGYADRQREATLKMVGRVKV